MIPFVIVMFKFYMWIISLKGIKKAEALQSTRRHLHYLGHSLFYFQIAFAGYRWIDPPHARSAPDCLWS
jgi:hypothetical protein